MNNSQVVCFGEVLWDVFPTHKVIGGAPLNVALRLQSLTVNATMISSVGDDENGIKALDYINDNGLESQFIQKDESLDTGHVIVSLDDKGSASYEIFKPVAWDNIKITKDTLELVSNSQIFVFGSLASRAPVSKNTLLQCLENANYKVFDVNLRKPDYTIKGVLELMHKADFIKMNDDELTEICIDLNCNVSSIEAQIQYISKTTNTQTICITKGGDGAILFQNGEFYKNKGYKVIVEDTVGAGDSFLASLITKLLIEDKNPQVAIDFACAVGALVASKRGANSKITLKDIQCLLNS